MTTGKGNKIHWNAGWRIAIFICFKNSKISTIKNWVRVACLPTCKVTECILFQTFYSFVLPSFLPCSLFLSLWKCVAILNLHNVGLLCFGEEWIKNGTSIVSGQGFRSLLIGLLLISQRLLALINKSSFFCIQWMLK